MFLDQVCLLLVGAFLIQQPGVKKNREGNQIWHKRQVRPSKAGQVVQKKAFSFLSCIYQDQPSRWAMDLRKFLDAGVFFIKHSQSGRMGIKWNSRFYQADQDKGITAGKKKKGLNVK